MPYSSSSSFSSIKDTPASLARHWSCLGVLTALAPRLLWTQRSGLPVWSLVSNLSEVPGLVGAGPLCSARRMGNVDTACISVCVVRVSVSVCLSVCVCVGVWVWVWASKKTRCVCYSAWLCLGAGISFFWACMHPCHAMHACRLSFHHTQNFISSCLVLSLLRDTMVHYRQARPCGGTRDKRVRGTDEGRYIGGAVRSVAVRVGAMPPSPRPWMECRGIPIVVVSWTGG